MKHRTDVTIVVPRTVLAGRLLLVLIALAVLMGVLPASAAERGNQALVHVGELARFPEDSVAALGSHILEPAFLHEDTAGTIILMPEARQLWQIYPYNDAQGMARSDVAVRDINSLAVVATIRLDFAPLRTSASPGQNGEWIHAVDGSRRIFVASDDYLIVEIDLATFALREHGILDQEPVRVTTLGGMTYDEGSESLWVVHGANAALSAAGALTTYLVRLDVASGEVSPRRVIRSCDGPYPATTASESISAPPMVRAGHVFVACHRTGYAGAIARLPVESATDPAGSEDLVVGPPYVEGVLSDQESGRMFLLTKRAEIWAFDTETMAFVGVVAADVPQGTQTRVGFGIDGATGRVFFLGDSYGLGVVEGRFFPIPQARTEPHLRARGQERIWSDASTGRVFVLPLEDEHARSLDAYRIYQADPAPAPPPPPDPDTNTVDRDEEPGVTEARLFASGSGYGARVLLAKGFATFAPAPSVGLNNPIALVINDHVNSKCGYTDRELVAGRVAKAEYDTGSTAAEAIAVGIDHRTVLDLDRPSRCDATLRDTGGNEVFSGIFATAPSGPVDNPDGSAPRWNREPATCSSSTGGEAEQDAGDDHGAPPLGQSRVVCPEPGDDLTARAESSLVGGVSVARAWTDTTITRKQGGVQSVVEAVAQGVSIADVIHIGEIKSVATSTSNGRPRDGDMSSHVVTIKGLSIAGTPICGVCDTEQAVEALNQAAVGRAQFRVGDSGLDRGLVTGTPKGALTAVQKSVQRQVSDQALIGDFTTEVPGLEVIVYNDNFKWGRARQLYQFAGVATAATYNITVVPTFVPGGGTASLPPEATSLVPSSATESAGELGARLAGGDRLAGDDRGGVLGFVDDVVDAVAGGLRLILSSPREALLLLTAWVLFGLPAALARRRALLAGLGDG